MSGFHWPQSAPLTTSCIMLIFCWVGSPSEAGNKPDPGSLRQHRQPAAAVLHGERLFVANRGSGSISCIDISGRRLVAEYAIGKGLSDLCWLPNHGGLVACDADANCIRLLKLDSSLPVEIDRLPVSTCPERIAVSRDGTLIVVSCRWSRRLHLIGHDSQLRDRGFVDLPFVPDQIVILPDRDIAVVASAFRGKLATVKLTTRRIEQVYRLDGHNIRGLAVESGQNRLYLAHQIANSLVPTVPERLVWGAVIGNQLRAVPLDDLLEAHGDRPSPDRMPKVRPIPRWTLSPLGEPGRGAGDPSALTIGSLGTICVATSGTGEIHVRPAGKTEFHRIGVGEHPVDIVLDDQESLACVVNAFDESVSLVDLNSLSVVANIGLGPRPEFTLIDRGRSLFFNSRLSLDGWYSCHSCHSDGHTSGRIVDNFSDGSAGTPKLVPPLAGVIETPPWAWNGQQHGLGEQVDASIRITMRGNPDLATQQNLDAIVAFMQSLKPVPSINEARGLIDKTREIQINRGRILFGELGCTDCHRPWTYSSDRIVDVGLTDEAGGTIYNPPSLRSVSQRGPFYHDGRASTLRDVLTTHRHAGLQDLDEDDIKLLLEFLNSL